MTRRRIVCLIAAKDLRIERHSRVVVNQILPFAGVTMVMFGFAIDSSDVVWVASMVLAISSAFTTTIFLSISPARTVFT